MSDTTAPVLPAWVHVGAIGYIRQTRSRRTYSKVRVAKVNAKSVTVTPVGSGETERFPLDLKKRLPGAFGGDATLMAHNDPEVVAHVAKVRRNNALYRAETALKALREGTGSAADARDALAAVEQHLTDLTD